MRRTETTPFRLTPDSDRQRAIAALAVHPSMHRLSRRQVEVAWAVADGMTNKQIASALELAPETVRAYIARIRHRWALDPQRDVRVLITRAVIMAWSDAA